MKGRPCTSAQGLVQACSRRSTATAVVPVFASFCCLRARCAARADTTGSGASVRPRSEERDQAASHGVVRLVSAGGKKRSK